LRECRIGIRNEDGPLYRGVRLYSLAEWSKLAAAAALGFEEDIGFAGRPEAGYDVTLKRRP
jgi:hypothetical protein